MLDVFTSTGAIREDFTDAEIASLPEAQREKWAELAVANQNMLEAERAHREAQADISAAVKRSQDADDALANARPKITHIEAARAASEAQRTGVGAKPDPVIERRVIAAAAAADAASVAVGKAHRVRATADIEVRRVRVAWAHAVQSWCADAPKPDQKQMMAHVATTQTERDQAERALTEAKPATHLDQVLKNSHGRRGRLVEHPNARRLAR